VREHTVEALIPGSPPVPPPKGEGESDDRRGQDREGESPREGEAQESQDAGGPQRCGTDVPTRQGDETPEARPRRTRSSDAAAITNGPSMIRDERDLR